MKGVVTFVGTLFSLLSLAQPNQDSLTMEKVLSQVLEDGLREVHNDSVQVEHGNLFTNGVKHAYFKYEAKSGTHVKIFSLASTQPRLILYYDIGSMNFISDSIFDINGNGMRDFAVHWYPSSGCCLADAFDCYVYNAETDKFSKQFHILNPTFRPENKTTFSMDYGHPGETMFYEFKWDDKDSMDTLLTYAWESNEQKAIEIIDFKTHTTTLTKSIPDKLKSLHGYDWFETKVRSNSEDE